MGDDQMWVGERLDSYMLCSSGVMFLVMNEQLKGS